MSTVPIWMPALDVEEILEQAARASRAGRSRSYTHRAQCALAAAAMLEHRASELARLITIEMRKPIRGAKEEILKCARLCRQFAEQGAAALSAERIEHPQWQASLRHEPLGVILGVMPWNFPFWQVFRFAVPALLAGNAVVVKHSERVPQCAQAVEDLLAAAGFADGLVRVIAAPAEEVYRFLEDERVRAVVFTGGFESGSRVAAFAAARIKKAILELGGSDPFVVMPSANLEEAVAAGVRSRVHCSGQACTAAKRFIVHAAVAGAFERSFAAALSRLQVGDPLDERTDVGPLAFADVADRLQRQVERTVAMGARVVTGGRREEGNLYLPTLLANVPSHSPAAQEETFGPVAALFRARDEEEAIRIANDTPFGLGASIWSSDEREIERLSVAIECGQLFVNSAVSSDPRLPFGGVKASGFGRELGTLGMRELTNIKTVVRC